MVASVFDTATCCFCCLLLVVHQVTWLEAVVALKAPRPHEMLTRLWWDAVLANVPVSNALPEPPNQQQLAASLTNLAAAYRRVWRILQPL